MTINEKTGEPEYELTGNGEKALEELGHNRGKLNMKLYQPLKTIKDMRYCASCGKKPPGKIFRLEEVEVSEWELDSQKGQDIITWSSISKTEDQWTLCESCADKLISIDDLDQDIKNLYIKDDEPKKKGGITIISAERVTDEDIAREF